MNIRSANVKNGKASELQFAAIAMKLGFSVLQPLDESNPYDFVLAKDNKFIKIQVKSTHKERVISYIYKDRKVKTLAYTFNTSNGKHIGYTKKQIDFLVLHIEPTNAWYIIPADKAKSTCISILKYGKNSKYDKYKDNFEILED